MQSYFGTNFRETLLKNELYIVVIKLDNTKDHYFICLKLYIFIHFKNCQIMHLFSLADSP